MNTDEADRLINRGLSLGIILALGLFVFKVRNMSEELKNQPYADHTPEIRTIEAMRHNALDGLYLTVEESRKLESPRQITFFDYGFDGKLDRVIIRQDKRQEYKTTNPLELAKWQLLFEEKRNLRFGIYEKYKER